VSYKELRPLNFSLQLGEARDEEEQKKERGRSEYSEMSILRQAKYGEEGG